MIPIRSNELAGLEWRQPSALARTYELCSGDNVLARVDWLKTFGTLTAAETADARWTFKRSGFLSPVVTARLEGSETDLAAYRPNWTGSKGEILTGNERLMLKASNFWSTCWDLMAGETVLLSFRSQGVLKQGARVEVSEAGKARPDLAMLICFTWYILLLHMQDSAAVVIST